MNESKLSKFGYNFQIKTIACFISRSNFFEQICDILDEKYYESDALKWIIGECKKYFFEYKKIITFDIFKIKVSEIENDMFAWHHRAPNDGEYKKFIKEIDES